MLVTPEGAAEDSPTHTYRSARRGRAGISAAMPRADRAGGRRGYAPVTSREVMASTAGAGAQYVSALYGMAMLSGFRAQLLQPRYGDAIDPGHP